MVTLWADENVPYPLVEALRALGHDVLTAYEDGRANQKIPDEEVLRHTTEISRAVLTNNRGHFHRLHRECEIHAGIITFTDDRDATALAARIHAEVVKHSDLKSELIKIVRPGKMLGGSTQS